MGNIKIQKGVFDTKLELMHAGVRAARDAGLQPRLHTPSGGFVLWRRGGRLDEGCWHLRWRQGHHRQGGGSASGLYHRGILERGVHHQVSGLDAQEGWIH